MERKVWAKMNQPIQEIWQAKSIQRKKAHTMQKVLWHSRWIALSILIVLNAMGLMNSLSISFFLASNGIGFCLYFLLGQLEGYYECKSNCWI
jgi:archaellum biogenesis protein FlaJ (TadC family)